MLPFELIHISRKGSYEQYKKYPPGRLDPNRLMRNEPAWIHPAPSEVYIKKTLVLSDWSAWNWSSAEITTISAALKLLLDDEFSIYYWQAGKVEKLTHANLNVLQNPQIRNAITPATATEIFAVLSKIPSAQIFFLDNYWIKQLCSKTTELIPYTLKTIDTSIWENQDLLIQIICTAKIAPVNIIFHEISTANDSFFHKLSSYFPHAQFKLVLAEDFAFKFDINHIEFSEEMGNFTFANRNFNLNILKKCQNLHIFSANAGKIYADTFLDLVEHSSSLLNNLEIKKLLIYDDFSFPQNIVNIKKLNLQNIVATEASVTILQFELPYLNYLNLSSGCMYARVLFPILQKMPKLEILVLNNVRTLIDDPELATLYLPCIEKIYLSDSVITASNLFYLLDACPNIQSIDLRNAQILNEDNAAYLKNDLVNLKKIDLNYSNITAEILHQILIKSPNLNAPDTTNCKNLDSQYRQGNRCADDVAIQMIENQVVSCSVNNTRLLPITRDQPFNSSLWKDLEIPSPADFIFEYHDTNDTKNQYMIIQKFSQYCIIKRMYRDKLYLLTLGICSALTQLFIDLSPEEWNKFFSAIYQWNGLENSITPQLEEHFKQLLDYIDSSLSMSFFNMPIIPSVLGAGIISFFNKYATFLGSLAIPLIPAFLVANKSPFHALLDSLDDFLRTNKESCLLTNPWHQIAIRPNGKKWEIYDPNSIAGIKILSKEQLPDAIHFCLGPLVAVRFNFKKRLSNFVFFNSPFNARIDNPGAFIKEGGLIILLAMAGVSFNTIKKLLAFNNYTREDLGGILLKYISHYHNLALPVWYMGISTSVEPDFSDSLIAMLTVKLLREFIKHHQNYKVLLENSLGKLSSAEVAFIMERISCLFPHEIIKPIANNVIINIEPSNDSEEISRSSSVQSERNSSSDEGTIQLQDDQRFSESEHRKSSNCLSVCSYTSTELASEYLDIFQQRKQAIATDPVSLIKYCETIFSSAIRKRLIKLSTAENMFALRLSLQNYGINQNYPIFYVNDPADLNCLKPYIVRQDNNIGISMPGPGGALFEFITNNMNNECAIIICYSNFKDEDLISTNSIIDKIPRVDFFDLPDKCKIIGLTNVNSPNYYEGADFISRFDQIEICPVPSSDLILPPLSIIPKDDDTPTYIINFFNSSDWKERLLGTWELDGKHLNFKTGELLLALQSKLAIELQNAPWDDHNFIRFWQEAYYFNYIKFENNFIRFCDVKIIRNDGYNWELLRSYALLSDCVAENSLILNPGLLSDFLQRYELEELNLIKKPGFIAKNAGKILPVIVTRALNQNQWAILLHACVTFDVTLKIFCAPGVIILPQINTHYIMRQVETKLWDGELDPFLCVIFSTDYDTTVAQLNRFDWDMIIDISECEATDLLERLDGKYNLQNSSFEFTKKQCALISGLEANQNILLQGNCTPDLIDNLAPLLLQRLANKSTTNRLAIVVSPTNSLQFLPHYLHRVSNTEKIKYLGDAVQQFNLQSYLAVDSLAKLKARINFLQNNTEENDSEKVWHNFYHIKLDLEDTRDRCQMVNKALLNSNYVFILGHSGGGKSTCITKEFAQGDDQIFFDKLTWALAKGKGRKFLILEEATCDITQHSDLEGLYNPSPGILINGEYYNLTKDNYVIAIGNPLSTGEERQLGSFFKRHGNTLVFNPLPGKIILNKILMPIFELGGGMINFSEGAQHLLKVYDYLCGRSVNEILISPRELETIALLSINFLRRYPNNDPYEVVQHFTYQITQELPLKDNKEEFVRLFKPTSSLSAYVERKYSDFVITESRKEIVFMLNSFLELWEMRQELSIKEDKRWGGLGGVILNGEPAVGKSQLVTALLEAHNFIEKKDLFSPALDRRIYYRMSAAMGIEEKRKLLYKAFYEGAVVFIDEINSAGVMENLLNCLLLGTTPEGDKSLVPSFMIIGTQNPITMSGRRALSTALARRMWSIEVPIYLPEEFKLICLQEAKKNSTFIPPAKIAGALTKIYSGEVYCDSGLKTPTPRDLLELASSVSPSPRTASHNQNTGLENYFFRNGTVRQEPNLNDDLNSSEDLKLV